MVLLSRPGVWISVLIASLLLTVAAVIGVYLALKPSGSDRRQDGFLAYGQVSVAIFGDDVNTPQSKRCIANSVQAGIIRQGTPVIISLNGNAVGGGNLSTGQFKPEMPQRGYSESLRATCLYKFSAPVTRPGDGQYTVDIGTARVAFSMNDLRNGINLDLS
jgi:hypothetical protein